MGFAQFFGMSGRKASSSASLAAHTTPPLQQDIAPGPVDVAALLPQLEADILLTMRVIMNASGGVQERLGGGSAALAELCVLQDAHARDVQLCHDSAAQVLAAYDSLRGCARDGLRDAASASSLCEDARDLMQAVVLRADASGTGVQALGQTVAKLDRLARQGHLLALNARLQASNGRNLGVDETVLAKDGALLAAGLREASETLSSKVAALEGAAAQNDLAMGKLQAIFSHLSPVLEQFTENFQKQQDLHSQTRPLLAGHAAATLGLLNTVTTLGLHIGRAGAHVARAQHGGLGIGRQIERLSRRSVVFLRNSGHGNRRWHPRMPVKVPGEQLGAGPPRPVMTLDISRGGCVLLGPDCTPANRLHPGDMARLYLESIGPVAATVLATSELGSHLRFDEISALALQRIDRLIGHVSRETAPAIALALATAAEVAQAFELAVNSGAVSLGDLLSDDYMPVSGSDPVQYVTASLALCEHALPPILAQACRSPLLPVFVVATDRNAYAPVHQPEYSLAQRPGQTAWNDLHCRNRCLHDRWLTLIGARNRARYSQHAYVRHASDGTCIPIQVIAAPVAVHGHLWGNVQVGCAY